MLPLYPSRRESNAGDSCDRLRSELDGHRDLLRRQSSDDCHVSDDLIAAKNSLRLRTVVHLQRDPESSIGGRPPRRRDFQRQ